MALSREEIASRYSKALFAYAQDANSLDAVHEDMNVLLQVAKANKALLYLEAISSLLKAISHSAP